MRSILIEGNMMDNISVVIPCYNCDSTIKKCLDSIGHNCEIILVNDCSSDRTEEVILDYIAQSKESNIKYYKNAVNVGAGETRNKGIDLVTGDYILFVDSDDLLRHGAIDKLKKIIKHEQYDCIIYDADIVREKKQKKLKMLYSNKVAQGVIDKKIALVYTRGSTCGKMYKTSIVKKNNIKFGSTKINEDLVFTKIALLNSDRIYYLAESLYIYNQLDTSLMHAVKFDSQSSNIEEISFELILKYADGKFSEELNSIYFMEVFYSKISRMLQSGVKLKECKLAKRKLQGNYQKPDMYFNGYILKYKLAYRFIQCVL